MKIKFPSHFTLLATTTKDDSTYDTVFQTTSGDALILRVHFPPSLTDNGRPPQMTLVGVKATHPWLDRNMKIVGYSAIQSDASWREARTLLGVAVTEVVTHLQLNPPVIEDLTDPGLAKLQATMGGSLRNTTSSKNQNNPPNYNSLVNSRKSPPPPVDMPIIPQQFPDELNSKSREELQKLLKDEIEFLSVVGQTPVYREMKLQRESILDENAKLATSMLERQEEYAILHGQVTDLKESLATKLEEFTAWQQKQDEFLKPPNLALIQKELNRSRKKAFDESETMGSDWAEGGEGTVDDFCKNFIELRHEMHLRAAKLERLKHQTETGYV